MLTIYRNDDKNCWENIGIWCSINVHILHLFEVWVCSYRQMLPGVVLLHGKCHYGIILSIIFFVARLLFRWFGFYWTRDIPSRYYIDNRNRWQTASIKIDLRKTTEGVYRICGKMKQISSRFYRICHIIQENRYFFSHSYLQM